jgi:hypothetical protein
MRAEAYVEREQLSRATEAARLCRENSRETGVKSDRKYKKREESSSMSRRFYHVDDGVVDFCNMTMTVAPFGNKKNKESISYFYNFRSDPKLGLGRIAGRRVPCACSSCSQQLELDWIDNVPAENQPRYKQNKNCHLWKIFEGLND